MDFAERTLSQEIKFKGRIMTARLDTARLPNGRIAEREVCEHVGGVAVLPIDQEGNILMVRQFRYPFGRVLWEIPAGKMDHGPEDAQACGERELQEETGCIAGEMISLGEIYPSPGFLTEVNYLFAARYLTEGECHPDEDEFVEVVRMPVVELEAKILTGEIQDAKTIAAMYRARLMGLWGDTV